MVTPYKNQRPPLLIPLRLSASAARNQWVRLLVDVSAHGHPLEITRRQRRSVFLVRAADFESGLGRNHPWSQRRARLAPHTYRPNGLEPGVTHRWDHASSTWIRDHFGQVLEAVDLTQEPMLVTRRGKSGLILLPAELLLAYWQHPKPSRIESEGGQP